MKKILSTIIGAVIITFVFLYKVSNPNVFEARITNILDDDRLIVQPINGLEEKEIFIWIIDESQEQEWILGEIVSIKYEEIYESSPPMIYPKKIEKIE